MKESQPIVKKKACEFLKFVKHSEYSIVEQLNKIPARISILSLLQNFELPRNVLLKALDKAYVAQNISVKGIDQLVGNIIVGAFIAFLDDEIPPKGKESTKTLHITIKCKNYIMPRTLLDNGSSLNVIPISTLSRLSIDLSYMKKICKHPILFRIHFLKINIHWALSPCGCLRLS